MLWKPRAESMIKRGELAWVCEGILGKGIKGTEGSGGEKYLLCYLFRMYLI